MAGIGVQVTNGHCEVKSCSKDYCVSGKVFQSAKQMFIHTGNLTNWSRSASKVVKNTTEEICENVIKAVNSSAPGHDHKYSKQKSVRFANKALVEKVKSEERSTLKVSVKIFLNEEDPRDLQEAVFRDMTELGVDLIDVVILSLPPFINPENEFPKIHLMWQELEKLVEQEYVGGLAVCDFSKEALEKLCKTAKKILIYIMLDQFLQHDFSEHLNVTVLEFIQSSRSQLEIKPIVDQINLASCCVMPQDLVTYAEKEGIQLLTHSDPKDIVPSEKLLDKINKSYDFPEPIKGWRYSWVTSYSVIIRCRTIIQNKGYIVNLVRDM